MITCSWYCLLWGIFLPNIIVCMIWFLFLVYVCYSVFSEFYPDLYHCMTKKMNVDIKSELVLFLSSIQLMLGLWKDRQELGHVAIIKNFYHALLGNMAESHPLKIVCTLKWLNSLSFFFHQSIFIHNEPLPAVSAVYGVDLIFAWRLALGKYVAMEGFVPSSNLFKILWIRC